MACINASIHFIPFVFTGGPKGSKTQAYRDYQSYIQQRRVKIPNPEFLTGYAAKCVNKWIREHIELQYVMDAAHKTERKAAPDGKHDDYCDSSVIALHATLTMLPASAGGSFGGGNVSQNRSAGKHMSNRSAAPFARVKRRNIRLNKPNLGNI